MEWYTDKKFDGTPLAEHMRAHTTPLVPTQQVTHPVFGRGFTQRESEYVENLGGRFIHAVFPDAVDCEGREVTGSFATSFLTVAQ